MSQYVSKYVKCPYYRRHDINRICCEGTEDSNGINLVFNNPTDLKEYGETYCNDIHNYHNCWLCLMHDRRYGYDE